MKSTALTVSSSYQVSGADDKDLSVKTLHVFHLWKGHPGGQLKSPLY